MKNIQSVRKSSGKKSFIWSTNVDKDAVTQAAEFFGIVLHIGITLHKQKGYSLFSTCAYNLCMSKGFAMEREVRE